jgi:hypothetical protein
VNKLIFVPKSHEKSTFSFKSCENRYPQSSSWSWSGNFLKAGTGAETNSFSTATLSDPLLLEISDPDTIEDLSSLSRL